MIYLFDLLKIFDMKNILFAIVASITLASCAQETASKATVKKATPKNLESFKTAYFASGCFWCVEEVFESVKGVEEAVSGYAGGDNIKPTYEQVSAGKTKHAEAVKVYYDPKVVSFETLVDVFFNSHDPSTKNQQGPDRGAQYRSIAFYQNAKEKEIIESKILTLLTEKIYTTITTEVKPFTIFYEAEGYHQDYVRKHPDNGYVQNVSVPRLKAFKKKMPHVLKK